jgi:hypothetical protein
MLESYRVQFAALALVTTVAAAAASCSDGATTDPTGKGASTGQMGTTSTSSGSGGAGGEGGAGGSAPTCMGEGTVLAATELLFGEGNSGEWKAVGFNVDGLVSTANSKDVCLPNSGADPSTPYPDGDDGIDNSFGKNLLPVILSLYQNWVNDINNGIQKGFFTSMLKMECLPPTGDFPVMNTKLFGGTTLPMAPLFDGTDKWPVAPELLGNSMDPNSSTVMFPKSSVTGDLFDSGKNQTFILTVPLKTMTATTSIKLTLYAAQIQMTLAKDRKSSTGGMIGGVLNTEEFVAEIKKVGFLLDLCGTIAFDNLITAVRQASDIMADGTQDPTKTCDGISMGLGFEMKEVQIGDVGPPTPVGMSCQ